MMPKQSKSKWINWQNDTDVRVHKNNESLRKCNKINYKKTIFDVRFTQRLIS